MFKKVISISLLCLVSASSFASPWSCLRHKLHDEFGLNENIASTHHKRIMPAEYLPNVKPSSYMDVDFVGFHKFFFYNVGYLPSLDRDALFDAASSCHCTVHYSELPDGKVIKGWCWDV